MKKLSKEEIHEIHQRNQAWKLHEELDSPQAYLNKVTKDIPLNDLYEVLDYIYVGKDQEICPVLLEIKDKDLRAYENGGVSKDDVTKTPPDNDDEVEQTPDIFGKDEPTTAGQPADKEFKYIL